VGQRLADIAVADQAGLAPVEINRGGHVITAPRGDHVLQAEDRLVMASTASGVQALHGSAGLSLATDHAFAARVDDVPHHLSEVVVSERCPLVGEAVGDGSFRRLYNAAVIAVARHGERVRGVSAWRLRPGDILLVAAGSDFEHRHRYSPDFHLVAGRGRLQVASSARSWAAIAVLAAMVGLAASGVLPMFSATVLAVLVLLAGRFVDRREARGAIDTSVLLTIAFALGIGAALADSGAAGNLAQGLLALAGDQPWACLIAIYLSTTVLTELVTNTAAAALMVPIALSTAAGLEVSHAPFVAVVMVAASASFVTPLGYQTNLMVAGPGGYHFGDFVRAGLPVSLAVAATTVLLVPVIWPW
jgi:di/tricarboxylate transporter